MHIFTLIKQIDCSKRKPYALNLSLFMCTCCKHICATTSASHCHASLHSGLQMPNFGFDPSVSSLYPGHYHFFFFENVFYGILLLVFQMFLFDSVQLNYVHYTLRSSEENSVTTYKTPLSKMLYSLWL